MIEGLLVRDSPESLSCVLEQDTLSAALVLVQPKKTWKSSRHDGNLLTGT